MRVSCAIGMACQVHWRVAARQARQFRLRGPPVDAVTQACVDAHDRRHGAARWGERKPEIRADTDEAVTEFRRHHANHRALDTVDDDGGSGEAPVRELPAPERLTENDRRRTRDVRRGEDATGDGSDAHRGEERRRGVAGDDGTSVGTGADRCVLVGIRANRAEGRGFGEAVVEFTERDAPTLDAERLTRRVDTPHAIELGHPWQIGEQHAGERVQARGRADPDGERQHRHDGAAAPSEQAASSRTERGQHILLSDAGV